MRRMNLVLMSFASATVIAVALLASGQGRTAGNIPLGTTFTYQGQLLENDILVEGMIELEFTLWDSQSDGNPVGDPITTLVDVQAGLFTVQLDFGKGAFNGAARWLEIAVEGTTLDQRQLITATPYGLYALNAGQLDGLDSFSFLRNLPDAVQSEHIARSAVDSSKIANNAVQKNHIAADAVGSNAIQNGSITRSDLGGSSVGTIAIQDNSILAIDLAADSVGSSEIARSAVGPSELANAQASLNKVSGGAMTSSSGNVGIGTTSPGAKLDVNGLAAFNQVNVNGSGSQTLYVAGTGMVTGNFDVGGRFFSIEGGRVNAGGIFSGSRGGVTVKNGNGAQYHYLGPNGGSQNPLMTVIDAGGTPQAGFYINASGQGVVFKDIDNFRIPNPNEPDTDIWYASIEGPEAAAYIRGTGHLINGRALVTFPDHFQTVATSEGMTVQVTPLSAESKGLAVVEKSLEGFVLRELFRGTGTYDFDYMVMAVRKGYENYRVIRPTDEVLLAPALEAEEAEVTP